MASDEQARVDDGWVTAFEARYGNGSFDRLMAAFEQPCVTFQDIGGAFGVTRERVRQWHLKLMPDAPRGHARQHLCLVHSQKRRLFTDPLFRAFSRHARSAFEARRLALIPARDGFRKRAVKLGDRVIAIRTATRREPKGGDESSAAYVLTHIPEPADFIYYRLGEDDYLFLPREVIPPDGLTFVDAPRSRFGRFRNTFAAALAPRPTQKAS